MWRSYFWRGLAMALSLPAQIMAARLIGPEENGRLAFVLSLVWPAALLVSLNGGTDLLRRHHAADAAGRDLLLRAAWLMRAFSWTVVALVGMAAWLAFGAGAAMAVAWASLVWCAGQDFTWICQARGRLDRAYQFFALQGAVTLVLTLWLVGFRPRAETFLAILAAGGLLSQVVAWRWSGVASHVGWKGVPALACDFWRSQFPLLGTALFGWAFNGLEVVFLSELRGDHETGLYRSALSSVAPLNTLLGVVSTALFPRVLEAFRQGQAGALLLRVLRIGFALLAAGAALAWLLGPFVFGLVWGEKYAPATQAFVLQVCSKLLVGFTLVLACFPWALRRDWSVLAVTAVAAPAAAWAYASFVPGLGCTGAAFSVLLAETGVFLAILCLAWKAAFSQKRA